MEIVKLNDIDLSNLEKSRFQGSTSTIYKNNDTCIKMLDKLFPEEKEIIYRKFLAMDGIKNVIMLSNLKRNLYFS